MHAGLWRDRYAWECPWWVQRNGCPPGLQCWERSRTAVPLRGRTRRTRPSESAPTRVPVSFLHISELQKKRRIKTKVGRFGDKEEDEKEVSFLQISDRFFIKTKSDDWRKRKKDGGFAIKKNEKKWKRKEAPRKRMKQQRSLLSDTGLAQNIM